MSDNIRMHTFKQKKAYYEYLDKRNEIISVEQESIKYLNDYYELRRIPMKIIMVAINKDIVDNRLLDLKENKSMLPLLCREINVDITVLYELKFITSIRKVIEDIRQYLKNDIDKCIKVKKRPDGRPLFILHLTNIDDQAVIDDVIDAIYYATDKDMIRRRRG